MTVPDDDYPAMTPLARLVTTAVGALLGTGLAAWIIAHKLGIR